jgi:hypothetical protein
VAPGTAVATVPGIAAAPGYEDAVVGVRGE